MKSKIRTVDALVAEEKTYPIKQNPTQQTTGIEIGILGFKNVQYKEHIHRPISKIINLSTLINE